MSNVKISEFLFEINKDIYNIYTLYIYIYICAAAYANIFMTSLDSKYIYPHIKEKSSYGLLIHWWPAHDRDWYRRRAIEVYWRTKPESQNDKVWFYVFKT